MGFYCRVEVGFHCYTMRAKEEKKQPICRLKAVNIHKNSIKFDLINDKCRTYTQCKKRGDNGQPHYKCSY